MKKNENKKRKPPLKQTQSIVYFENLQSFYPSLGSKKAVKYN